jgi:hypothetical protein
MDNPETLATLDTQDTGQRLEKTKGAIKNGQSRDTSNIGHSTVWNSYDGVVFFFHLIPFLFVIYDLNF